MAIIDQSKLPLEITSKYSIANNAFRMDKIKNAELDTYKNEPKDEINIFVGDDKVPDTFVPQLKLERWSNETNFSIRLIDDEVGQETVNTLADKIVWEKGDKKIEFYDFAEGEGGYKLVWFLKKKPKTNKVEFTIQSKGLDFFYQPELTAEELAEGASRPENVVGSCAVYHQTKGGMVDANGKDYKTGKAFHIYRPHIIDANGAETWGMLHIENGIYSVEIPQEFLDSAVYPIKSNDTFGYTTAGASEDSLGGSRVRSMLGTPASSGTVDSVSASVKSSVSPNLKGLIFLHGDLTLVANGVGGAVAVGSTKAWKTSTYSVKPSVSGGTEYLAGFIGSNTIFYYYDSVGTNTWHEDNTNDYTTPQDMGSATTYNSSPSIYATYTPSGGAAPVPTLMMMGIGT